MKKIAFDVMRAMSREQFMLHVRKLEEVLDNKQAIIENQKNIIILMENKIDSYQRSEEVTKRFLSKINA